MKKLVTPLLMTLAVMFGYAGTARAMPFCVPFCTCDLPCDSPCIPPSGPPTQTCHAVGFCRGGFNCPRHAPSAQPAAEVFTAFVAHPRQVCVAGDDADGAAGCDAPQPAVATTER
jgi:hypothetical protein